MNCNAYYMDSCSAYSALNRHPTFPHRKKQQQT